MMDRLWIALYLCILLASAAVLYDQFTKRIPSRLRAEEAPKSEFGLVRADKLESRGRAGGIDIIFVHGLGSNPDTTWGPRDGRCWVSDFLSEDIPAAFHRDTRIFFYNYDSYWKRDAVQGRLWSLAKSLLDRITSEIRGTEQERTRNLVFVGHSYGGLVIKRALIQASTNQLFATVAEHTRAVFFLGTPHRGSSFSTWGGIAARALQPLGSNPSLLQEVVYDSLSLLDLHEEFENVFSGKLRVVNFFEQRKTRILKLWFLQWEEWCVREQSAKYSKVENVGLPVDHYGLNKFSSKNENYKIILGKLIETITPIALQKQERFYSVPVSTVDSYTERPTLSAAVEERLRVRHRDATVPHALAIYGLGGTGKTQLALKYVDDHKDEYSPILWIDAKDEDSVRSSFERCASELQLSVDRTQNQGSSLLDSLTVQAVLRWLRGRKETDDPWLVILDNADDISWGIKKVLPNGDRGSIIITSQDRQSRKLVGGGCEGLHIVTMEPLEAQELLLRHLGLNPTAVPEDIQQDCGKIAEQLGYLALAVGLAGAYISNDADQRQALRQYLADYEKHQDDLLRSEHFRGLSASDKTVWTVWDTTLEKIEERHAVLRPGLLLALLARFRGSIVQDEIFRLASLGMAEVYHEFGDQEHKIPSDFRQFLTLDGMEWDSFSYRQSRDLLVRYNLAQRVDGEWPGVTMHSLVKWRAMQYNKSERWEWLHSLIVLAACHKLPQKFESLRFRRHLLVHVPEMAQDWLDRNKIGAKTRLFMQRTFNRVHYIRQEQLYHIHKKLSDADGRGIVVLYGVGGIGKTQLATTYTECYSANYSGVFWLDVGSEDSAKMSYARIAKKIVQEHPSASQFGKITTGGEEDEIMTAVKRWLNHPRNTRWLMICDQSDHRTAEDIRWFLPEANHGSVIITTRSSTAKIGCQIQVQNLDISDSLEVLSDTSLRKTAINDPDAAELAKQLHGLPHALANAGAYICHGGISFADYLHLYKATWLRLQQTSLGVVPHMDRASTSTLQLLFERVKQESELSAQLLQLWAYFDSQDLWLELLQKGSSHGPNWLCQLTEDESSFNREVTVLLDYGLVKVNMPTDNAIESGGYGLHSIVHMWTVHVLNKRWKVDMAGLALECVVSHIPVGDSPDSFAIQRRLLRHAGRCWSFIQDGLLDDVGRARAIHSLGYLFAQQGKYGDAEKMFQRALHGEERALGTDHTSTLDTVNSLGLLYADLGRLHEAEMMYQRALQGYEKMLGPDHASTLSAVNNLGLLYADLGHLHEAEMMYQRALQGYEKMLGPDHASTLSAVNNLGLLYADLGRLHEAEMMYQRALQGYEKMLGPDHPSNMTSMANLASTYRDQGRWKEAEALEVHVIETRKRVLGEEHPSTLSSIANLALTYRDQGRWKEAEALFMQTIEIRKRVLGEEHPSTLTSMANLASTYRNQGRWKEAEELELQVMETFKRVLGEEHPSTLTSMANLALTYWNQGRWKEAEELEVQVMESRKRVLGEEHPSTLTSMANLASTYRNQGRWKEAEELEVQVMEMFKRVLGEEHPSTLTGIANLASTYRNQGRWKEAEELEVQVIEIRKRVLGEEHPDTLTSMNNLAFTFMVLGKVKEAFVLMQDCYRLRDEVLGSLHPDTVLSEAALAVWQLEATEISESSTLS